MALVNVTINGRQVHARAGQTVLEAAKTAGIDIPTLCHHPALPPYGSCRVCLVEIEKQRTLQPSCTFPVFDGMVVQTESEKVVEGRIFALQMLFSERTHYCMFCPSSGSNVTTDCELQKLAYRYGMTCWEHAPDYSKRWPVDASNPYFIMDHSRCILCRRCVRACDTVSANHTLGVHERGASSMIGADDAIPIAESTCVSCGTCLQVCPTGALSDRRSSYLGHEMEVQRTRTTCLGCAVGCGLECLTRDNVLVRVEGDWAAENAGLLCVTGRFESVNPKPARVPSPMVRRNGKLVECGWGEALDVVVKQMQKTRQVAGLISNRTSNEGLIAFSSFFNELLYSDEVALLSGEVPPMDMGTQASLGDIADSDCVVVVGGDPVNKQKVVAHFIKRAVDREARLLIINDHATELDLWADRRMKLDAVAHSGASPFEMLRYTYHLRMDGVRHLKTAVDKATRPVVLYGPNLSTGVYAALRQLPRKAKFMPLVEGTNSAGAARLGLVARPVKGDLLYVLASDEIPDGRSLPEAAFTVIQAAYHSIWTEEADVVLPARTWPEKHGSVINLEGREMPVIPVCTPPKDVHPVAATLASLSALMGRPMMYGPAAEARL